jgi:hypothetical protein
MYGGVLESNFAIHFCFSGELGGGIDTKIIYEYTFMNQFHFAIIKFYCSINMLVLQECE